MVTHPDYQVLEERIEYLQLRVPSWFLTQIKQNKTSFLTDSKKQH